MNVSKFEFGTGGLLSYLISACSANINHQGANLCRLASFYKRYSWCGDAQSAVQGSSPVPAVWGPSSFPSTLLVVGPFAVPETFVMGVLPPWEGIEQTISVA